MTSQPQVSSPRFHPLFPPLQLGRPGVPTSQIARIAVYGGGQASLCEWGASDVGKVQVSTIAPFRPGLYEVRAFGPDDSLIGLRVWRVVDAPRGQVLVHGPWASYYDASAAAATPSPSPGPISMHRKFMQADDDAIPGPDRWSALEGAGDPELRGERAAEGALPRSLPLPEGLVRDPDSTPASAAKDILEATGIGDFRRISVVTRATVEHTNKPGFAVAGELFFALSLGELGTLRFDADRAMAFELQQALALAAARPPSPYAKGDASDPLYQAGTTPRDVARLIAPDWVAMLPDRAAYCDDALGDKPVTLEAFRALPAGPDRVLVLVAFLTSDTLGCVWYALNMPRFMARALAAQTLAQLAQLSEGGVTDAAPEGPFPKPAPDPNAPAFEQGVLQFRQEVAAEQARRERAGEALPARPSIRLRVATFLHRTASQIFVAGAKLSARVAGVKPIPPKE